MAETTTTTPNYPAHDALAALDSRYLDVGSMAWEQTRFPGVEVKTLLEDRERGLITTLVRMAPGAVLPDHEHVDIEQTWVLEGSLVDDQGEVCAGDFVWRPAASRHSARSPNGALLLGMFLAPNRFFDSADAPRGFDYAAE